MRNWHLKPVAAFSILAGMACLAASPAAASTVSRECSVDSVAIIDGRMHIKCVPLPTVAHTKAITYYAMPLTEPAAKVEGLIMLAIESKRTKKPLVLWFDMDDYKSVPGCQGSDCRRLKGAALE